MALPHTAFDILPGQFRTWNDQPEGSSVDVTPLLPLHIPSRSIFSSMTSSTSSETLALSTPPTTPTTLDLDATFSLQEDGYHNFVPTSMLTRSNSLAESSTSTLVSESIPSSATPFLEQEETALLPEDRHFAQAAMRKSRREERKHQPVTHRGPNKRRSGTGYVDMMKNLPGEVQDALRTKYEGCCEVVKGKDVSTLQKHWFSKGHFKRIPLEYQDKLPVFTCPAFIALNAKCKRAKAGRYDSTDRHCKSCIGYSETFPDNTASPIEVTIEEFKSVQAFRDDPEFGKNLKAPPLVVSALVKIVNMVRQNTGGSLEDVMSLLGLAPEPQHPPVIANQLDKDEERSPSPSPSPIQPQTPQPHEDQLENVIKTYHTTGNDSDQATPADVVQFYDAPSSCWDKWGSVLSLVL